MIGHIRCKARSICGHWGLGRAWADLGTPQKLGTLIERFLDGGVSPAPPHPKTQFLETCFLKDDFKREQRRPDRISKNMIYQEVLLL